MEGEDIHVSDGQVVVMAAPGPYHEVTQIAAGIRHSFVLIYELL